MQRKIVYILGVIFLISGATNIGLTGFFFAIPFAILLVFISHYSFKSKKLLLSSIFLILVCILVNITLEKNPFIFPILSGGTIEVLEDGYLVTYSDGSGGFSKKSAQEQTVSCLGPSCGTDKSTPLKKGEIYNVTGVSITHPDLHTDVSLITSVGKFDQYDYQPYIGSPDRAYIKTNKLVHVSLVNMLRYLMK